MADRRNELMDYSSFTRRNMTRRYPLHWNLLKEGEFYAKLRFLNDFFMNGCTEQDIITLKWLFPKEEFSEEVEIIA